MSYKCCDCGRVFEEPRVFDECVGEFWGAPAYERVECCPYCDGDFEDYDEFDDFEMEDEEEYEDA